MSNEELVAAIQAGDNSLLGALWQQCEKFIRITAKKWEAAFENKIRCDSDDLYQTGYFALCKAVAGYRQEAGSKFLGYLALHLKTEFAKAAGVRTTGQKNAPENSGISLYAPIRNRRGTTDTGC